MYSALITAIRTLTTIPVPGNDTTRFHHALPFFPVVGFLIALVVYPVFLICCRMPESLLLLGGVVFTLCLVLLTGGLHLDGLADATDGFLGGKDKESILRIMKDSRIGTFGATALFFDLITRVGITSYLIGTSSFIPFLCAFVNSRTIQAITLSICPYARGTEGTASPFSGAKHLFPVISAFYLLVNLCFFWIFKNDSILISCGSASLLSAAAVFFFLRRTGGITGDCIGAINEMYELVFLFVWCLSVA